VITMRPSDKAYDVYDGKRRIGVIVNIHAVDGVKAWRFLCSARNMVPMFPIPAAPHDCPESALGYVRRVLASN
jgi:hypothetical protein